MKILHFHIALRGGGIKTMICSLANAMVDAGEQVSICTIFEPESGDYAFGTLNKSIRTYSLGKRKAGVSLSSIIKVVRFLRTHSFDAVNIHGFFYYYALAVVLLHRKVKFFYTVHNDAPYENSRWDKLLLPLKRFCFRHEWMRAITISASSEQSFKQLYRGAKSTLINNGITLPHPEESSLIAGYRRTTKTQVFLNVGRISRAKNQVTLCKAVSRLINEGADITLLIVGPNQDDNIMRQILPFLGELIVYLGERNDVISLMTSADALCLPSLWEGLPITLLEAMSVGCIPICAPAGGIVNVLDNNKNGLLSTNSSEEDYLQSLRKYLNMSDEERQTMRQNAIATSKNYDIQLTARQYIELYQRQ